MQNTPHALISPGTVTSGTAAHREVGKDVGTLKSNGSFSGHQWGLQMRKLILIAVIATMSSSACHANLSLASNDTPQEAVEQPSLRAIEAKAEIKAEIKAEAPATAVNSPTVSKPKPRHQSGRTFVFHRSYRHCL